MEVNKTCSTVPNPTIAQVVRILGRVSSEKLNETNGADCSQSLHLQSSSSLSSSLSHRRRRRRRHRRQRVRFAENVDGSVACHVQEFVSPHIFVTSPITTAATTDQQQQQQQQQQDCVMYCVSEERRQDLWWTKQEIRKIHCECLFLIREFLQDESYVWALDLLHRHPQYLMVEPHQGSAAPCQSQEKEGQGAAVQEEANRGSARTTTSAAYYSACESDAYEPGEYMNHTTPVPLYEDDEREEAEEEAEKHSHHQRQQQQDEERQQQVDDNEDMNTRGHCNPTSSRTRAKARCSGQEEEDDNDNEDCIDQDLVVDHVLEQACRIVFMRAMSLRGLEARIYRRSSYYNNYRNDSFSSVTSATSTSSNSTMDEYEEGQDHDNRNSTSDKEPQDADPLSLTAHALSCTSTAESDTTVRKQWEECGNRHVDCQAVVVEVEEDAMEVSYSEESLDDSSQHIQNRGTGLTPSTAVPPPPPASTQPAPPRSATCRVTMMNPSRKNNTNSRRRPRRSHPDSAAASSLFAFTMAELDAQEAAVAYVC